MTKYVKYNCDTAYNILYNYNRKLKTLHLLNYKKLLPFSKSTIEEQILKYHWFNNDGSDSININDIEMGLNKSESASQSELEIKTFMTENDVTKYWFDMVLTVSKYGYLWQIVLMNQVIAFIVSIFADILRVSSFASDVEHSLGGKVVYHSNIVAIGVYTLYVLIVFVWYVTTIATFNTIPDQLKSLLNLISICSKHIQQQKQKQKQNCGNSILNTYTCHKNLQSHANITQIVENLATISELHTCQFKMAGITVTKSGAIAVIEFI